MINQLLGLSGANTPQLKRSDCKNYFAFFDVMFEVVFTWCSHFVHCVKNFANDFAFYFERDSNFVVAGFRFASMSWRICVSIISIKICYFSLKRSELQSQKICRDGKSVLAFKRLTDKTMAFILLQCDANSCRFHTFKILKWQSFCCQFTKLIKRFIAS